MAGADIKLVGFKELRKDLKALDEEGSYKPRLKAAGKNAAGVVVDEAKSLAVAKTRMGSRALGTIRALAGQTRAQVAIGSAAVPWAVGFNFGSSGRYKQFMPKHHPDAALYSAIEKKRAEVVKVYTSEIGDLLKDYHL